MVKKLMRLYVKASPLAVIVRRKEAALYSNSGEPKLVGSICSESVQSDLQINMHTKRNK